MGVVFQLNESTLACDIVIKKVFGQRQQGNIVILAELSVDFLTLCCGQCLGGGVQFNRHLNHRRNLG
jgi:hypothetical protein